MLELIATVIFAILIAFFAIQNSVPVNIHLNSYNLVGIPLYLVVLVSVLVTLLFSWIIFLVNSLSSSFAILGKNNSIKDVKRRNLDLAKKVHDLEIENAKLKGQTEVRKY